MIRLYLPQFGVAQSTQLQYLEGPTGALKNGPRNFAESSIVGWLFTDTKHTPGLRALGRAFALVAGLSADCGLSY